ncbi:MAG: hypothetical protein ACOX8A_11525 [Thermacetogeniaceae bacterium]|jgi:hypothetical protein
MTKMIRKSIAFNPADPDQAAMLKHAEERSNFSAYIKRLIYRDMSGVVEVAEAIDSSTMGGFV